MALTVTNTELEARVGRLLGYGDSGFVGQEAEDVERCVADGKRNFYNPPVPGGHVWSFLTPTQTITLVAGQSTYALPYDFAMLHGPLTYAVGSATLIHSSIEYTSPERVLERLNRFASTGVPHMAAVRPKPHNEGDFLDGIRYELLFYPTPADAYQIDIRYTINPLAPAGSSLLPIGDQAHVQTLIEACLAAAERFNNEGNGIHENEFQKLLASSIAHDNRVHAPDTLGQNTDTSDLRYDPLGSWRDLNVYVVDASRWGTP